MPSHLIARINADKLYPPFFRAVLNLLARCEQKHAHYYLQYGYRSFQEQEDIFAQGRTKPGLKVTKARGGQSTHNFGIGSDAIRDADLAKAGLQPYWPKDGYELLREEGEALGLQVALMGPKGLYDFGHIQLPLTKRLKRSEKSILLELRGIELSKGMPGVWAKLDEWGFDSIA